MRAHTGRDKIIKFEGCYHGHADPFLVQAGSGVATLGLPDSPGVPKAATNTTLCAPYNDLDAVKKIFEENKGEIAGVILEPVVGNSGFIVPDKSFLEGLREVTTANGALLCFDEVMTGFRISKGCAQEYWGVTPDLTTMGKVIGGGMPVGAYGGKREIMEVVAPAGPMYQAGTLSGNPLAMVAGIDRAPRKVTRSMSKEKIQKRTKMKPFLKYVNYTHLMPTRYVVDLDLKKIVDESGLKEGKAEARKAIKKVFEERYHQQSSAKKEKKAAGTMYFYKKMAF